VGEVRLEPSDYAPPTHIPPRYCQTLGIEDADRELRTANTGTAVSFLIHLCETYKIKSEGTGWQYFRQWKQRTSATASELGLEAYMPSSVSLCGRMGDR
jgi:hypothetical protein